MKVLNFYPNGGFQKAPLPFSTPELRFRPPMLRSLSPFVILGALLLGACQPKIGDECVTDLDCSQAGDRLCDTTQLDGYCTQADCSPTSCPEKESICVAFNNTVSTQGSCNVRGQTSPYLRTFCMATCKREKDCRNGYSCIDMSKTNDWGASIIEQKPEETSVCIQVMSFAEQDEEQEDEVCTGAAQEAAGGAGGAPN